MADSGTRPIPSPKFETKEVTQVLRMLKRNQIKKKSGEAYKRIYIKSNLKTLNTCANREIGKGLYSIREFCKGWYYLRVLDVYTETNKGRKAGTKSIKKESPLVSVGLLYSSWA